MLYEKQISIMLERFGRAVRVIAPDGSIAEAYAFIQPVQYKAKNYMDTEMSALGRVDGGVYLYIGKPSAEIPATGDDYQVKTDDGVYDVTRAEMVRVGEKPLYCWAVLKQRYENGEAEI